MAVLRILPGLSRAFAAPILLVRRGARKGARDG